FLIHDPGISRGMPRRCTSPWWKSLLRAVFTGGSYLASIYELCPMSGSSFHCTWRGSSLYSNHLGVPRIHLRCAKWDRGITCLITNPSALCLQFYAIADLVLIDTKSRERSLRSIRGAESRDPAM